MKEVKYATVRDGVDEWHIECRLSDGQKGAFITIDYGMEWLADEVCRLLNTQSPEPVQDGTTNQLPNDTELVVEPVHEAEGCKGYMANRGAGSTNGPFYYGCDTCGRKLSSVNPCYSGEMCIHVPYADPAPSNGLTVDQLDDLDMDLSYIEDIAKGEVGDLITMARGKLAELRREG